MIFFYNIIFPQDPLAQGYWKLVHVDHECWFPFKKHKTCTMCLLSCKNTSGGLGEGGMLWEQKPTGKCFHSLLPQLTSVSIKQLDYESKISIVS